MSGFIFLFIAERTPVPVAILVIRILGSVFMHACNEIESFITDSRAKLSFRGVFVNKFIGAKTIFVARRNFCYFNIIISGWRCLRHNADFAVARQFTVDSNVTTAHQVRVVCFTILRVSINGDVARHVERAAVKINTAAVPVVCRYGVVCNAAAVDYQITYTKFVSIARSAFYVNAAAVNACGVSDNFYQIGDG